MSEGFITGMRARTEEEILRDENAAIRRENERMGGMIRNSESKNACLKEEHEHLAKKISELESQVVSLRCERTEQDLRIASLSGKVEAYENIFAKHNLSLFAAE